MASNSKSSPSQQAKKRGKRQAQPRRQNAVRRPANPNLLPMYRAAPTVSKLAKYKKLMTQMMLPGSVDDPDLMPALASTQLTSRIIRKSYILGPADIDANGNSLVVLKPSIDGPAFITTPGASTFPPGGAAAFTVSGFDLDVDANGIVNGMWHLKDIDGNEDTLARSETLTFGGVSYKGLNVSMPASTSITYSITPKTKNTGFIPRFATSQGGVWTNWQAGQPTTYPDPKGFTFTFGAAASTGFIIQLVDHSGNPHQSPCKVDVNLTFGDLTHACSCAIAATTTALFSKFKRFVVDNGITQGRLCSMSLLATNCTAEVKKQGEIYAGRLQPEVLNVDLPDVPAHIIAQPPNRRHIGAAAEGAYCWWMPDSIATQEPGALNEVARALHQQEVLFVYFKGLDPASSFNLEFVWDFEFFTTNQVFPKRNTPPLGSWSDVLQVLSLAPAATCNPDHIDTLRAIVKRAADAGKGVYQHYKKHQALYDMALQALMSL